MFDLPKELNKQIQGLLLDAVRVAVKNPPMARYLAHVQGYLKRAEKLRERHEQEGLHVPPFLIASITDACNLCCSGCYAQANSCGRVKRPELTTARWRELFGEARALGVSFILLAGGEPLMRRDILELAADFPEILFPVFTNGTKFDEEYLKLFKNSRNILPVLSLEGSRAATDSRRGDGVYDRLAGAMRALESDSIFFGASVTVTRENIGEVTGDDFVNMLDETGCSLVFYVEYVPSDEKSENLAPDEADRKRIMAQTAGLRARHRMVFIDFPGDESLMGGCLAAGRGFFHIAADGSAEPCPFSPYSQLNLNDCTLRQALESDFFRRLRECGLLDAPHSGGCVLFERRGQVEEIVKTQ